MFIQGLMFTKFFYFVSVQIYALLQMPSSNLKWCFLPSLVLIYHFIEINPSSAWTKLTSSLQSMFCHAVYNQQNYYIQVVMNCTSSVILVVLLYCRAEDLLHFTTIVLLTSNCVTLSEIVQHLFYKGSFSGYYMAYDIFLPPFIIPPVS